MRAEAAEARIASLEAALVTRSRPERKQQACRYFRRYGHCRRGYMCTFAHEENVATLRQKLAAKEREVAALQRFGKLRSEMKANIAKVEEEMKIKYAKANSLDLVIAMDCTESMSRWIDSAKSSIIEIITNVKTDHPRAKVRVGFVAYRDFCDGANRLQLHQLTEAIESVRHFISKLGAFGGGDGPEDIQGGLEQVLKMDFQADAKRLVLVADAPCHGNEFHSMKDDQHYASQIRASPNIRTQMRELCYKGIDFTFIEIVPNDTAKMVAILQEEYKSAQSLDGLEREFLKISLANSGDHVRFATVVHGSASSSLSASKARSVLASSKKALGIPSRAPTRPGLVGIAEEGSEEKVAPVSSSAPLAAPSVEPLEWTSLERRRTVSAVRHSFHFRPGEPIDWSKLNLKHTTQRTTIRVLPTCFAKGTMRSAHAMYDCTMKKRLVAKFYFGKAAKMSSSSSACQRNDVEMQTVAKQLATEFSLHPEVEDAVDFIFTCWYEIEDPVAVGLHPAMKMFTAEPFIEGEYKKYNNNNGWVNEKILPLSDSAQAFSHFTWQKTYGQLLVVDLQGVGGVFTDPQIHALQESQFGHGNLSMAGMTAFFATHKCNSVCKTLQLSPFNADDEENSGKDDDTKEETKAIKDKVMTCSCPLCGSITTQLHSAFIDAHATGRDMYCDDCTTRVNTRETKTCVVCGKENLFSPYWYDMKGMEHPTTCKWCKT
ncbi:hypothetical protein Poli38472_006788 [Pythium oligandrum]|uniref:Alpha-type protein kinase domain-containing protein n=1 Tax=Pythium oligandrum TaxID=41045 RepID=A0A8K1C5G7_PYTOL|nr:hypothetical protein Poli38472_006788 [Pythium oligandrum]|eukprot:TMW56778.1 hypothetical protein Poli38472_006788 [Pythium oligandrum]